MQVFAQKLNNYSELMKNKWAYIHTCNDEYTHMQWRWPISNQFKDVWIWITCTSLKRNEIANEAVNLVKQNKISEIQKKHTIMCAVFILRTRYVLHRFLLHFYIYSFIYFNSHLYIIVCISFVFIKFFAHMVRAYIAF